MPNRGEIFSLWQALLSKVVILDTIKARIGFMVELSSNAAEFDCLS